MLRPARMLGLLSSPRSFPTGQPVYSRACSNEGLPSSKSAMTSRLNHLLPRQDLHLLACQRTKAALSPHFLNFWAALKRPSGGGLALDALRKRSQTSFMPPELRIYIYPGAVLSHFARPEIIGQLFKK